ncbi:hypothetical protein T439DRAFT_296751 [Meredithblackwellia eburnea MCA 4105]
MPLAQGYTAPRWVELLQKSLDTSMEKDKGTISYALATPALDGPRVRMVVHRGFLNERRPGEDPSWSGNPADDKDGYPLTSSTMLVTTDVRGPKASQITQNGTVELAWWLSPAQQQYRIRGKAWIFPPPGHPLLASFPAKELSPPNLPAFDWESERLRTFRKMNPPLRASFVRPIPGTKLAGNGPIGDDIDPSTFPTELPSDLELEDKSDKVKEEVKEALSHFSLIVIKPFAVDMCDLGAQPNERYQWAINDDGSTWTEDKVVP